MEKSNNSSSTVNPSLSAKKENMEDWRNEHGQPSFEYLQTLMSADNAGAMEKLQSIADDLDVEYGPGSSKEELVEKIMSAAKESSNATT